MDEQHGHEHAHETAPQKESGLLKKFLLSGTSNSIFSDKTIMVLLSLLTFLLPVFFIPSSVFSVEFSKTLLVEVVALVGVFAWGVSRLRDGKFSVPKSLVLVASFLILLQFIVAAIASPTKTLSFVGTASEIGTVASMAVLMLLMFLASLVFRSRDRVLTLYSALSLSAVVVMLYHLIRHVAGPILSFGIFTSPVSSPVGKWNDFASLVGVVMVLLLTTLYFFSRNKSLKIPGYILFTVSLFFLMVIDFTTLWIILFVLSGVMMLISILEGENAHRARKNEEGYVHRPIHRRIAGHIPVMAVVLFIVSFIYGSGLSSVPFNAKNQSISSTVSGLLRANPYSEVVLTPKLTYEITKETLSDQPFLGTGPNRFASGFLKHKTLDVNVTPFWDTSFDFGVGRVPTFFATTGMIGALLWMIFLIGVLLKMRKVYPMLATDRIGAYVGTSLFLIVVYLWSLGFFYLPNVAIFALAFIFTGALIGFLVGEGAVKEYHGTFSGHAIGSFIFTPLVVAVLIGTVSGGVLLYKQSRALMSYNNAQVAISNGNLDLAETYIKEAVDQQERDLYLRYGTSIALVKLQQLAQQGDAQDSQQVLQQADRLVTQARNYAERAIAFDETNFENYIALGSIYDTLGSLGVKDVIETARASYKKALELNPRGARVYFLLARIELVAGNQKEAKQYLYEALKVRPNFLEVISLLSQLEIQDKNIEGAIEAMKGGVQYEPTNFLLRFALGYLYYANGDYKSAIPEFEAAVIVNPVYADAKYFLGLSYAKVGRKDEALLQFQGVQELNPDNKDVANIVKNLKADKQPFDAGISTPSQPVSDALNGLEAENKKTTDTTATQN